jgi:hypothetical protein
MRLLQTTEGKHNFYTEIVTDNITRNSERCLRGKHCQGLE